ncbi:MAG: hypothetical protein MRQ09_01950 [Candidatus Midichloria sp.]|nr:hypothetical protein [Candidatus Midichloria sp.]
MAATNPPLKMKVSYETDEIMNFFELKSVHDLEKVLNSKEAFTAEEILNVQNFLVQSIANENLHKITTEIIKYPDEYKYDNIHISTVILINLFTHCTRHYNFCPSLEELKNVLNCISSYQESGYNEFSLQQIGAINDLALVMNFINELDQKKILEGNSILREVKEKIKLSSKINEVISTTFTNEELLNSSGSRNIIKQFSKQDLLKNLVDYYTSITKIIAIPNKEIPQDEWFTCQNNKATEDLEKRLFSNFYKIDLNQLFTKENQKILQKLYGKQWRDEVSSIIKEIENKIIADHIHEEEKKAQSEIKSFGEIHHNSQQLDHSNLNEANQASKYTLSKDPNMLMLASHECLIYKIIESLEKIIKNSITENNILNCCEDINIVRRPLKLNLLKAKITQ